MTPGWSPDKQVIGAGLPRQSQDVTDEKWMRRALEVAETTPAGDVPVGAVIVSAEGQELATGVNRREADVDPLGHAEIAAIAAAVQAHGDRWRLTDCIIYVTLEPCAMCAGALVGSRIGRIVYAAAEPKTGACGSVWDVPRESPLHKAQVRAGVLEAEAKQLLENFFREVRGA